MDSAAAVTAAAAAGGGGGKTTITKREKRQLEKKRKREEQEAKRNKEVEEGQWVESTSADGRITTAYLKQAGSKGTIGLRGQVIVGGREYVCVREREKKGGIYSALCGTLTIPPSFLFSFPFSSFFSFLPFFPSICRPLSTTTFLRSSPSS